MGKSLDNVKNKTGGSSTSSSAVGQVYLGQETVSGNYQAKPRIADKVVSVFDAQQSFYSWNDATIKSWQKSLAANGFKTDLITAKSIWDLSVQGASDWFSGSGRKQKITPQDYLTFYGKNQGQEKTGGAPRSTKNVYLFDKTEINKLITDKVSEVLGRGAQPEEMKHFYTVIKDMIDQGTVTTTKIVNGQTVTTQKPGFTQAKAEAAIESGLKSASPQDYQEKKSLDFADFLGRLGG
jgi:hypothetical protein